MNNLRVRDIVKLIKGAEEVNLCWNGSTHPFNPEDSVELDAFGDYAVESISASGDNGQGWCNCYEIGVRTTPVRVSA